MSFIDALLAVLIVIVFVAVVAVVIALIVDLFLAIVSPNTRGLFFRRNAKEGQKRPKMVESADTNTVTLDEYESKDKQEKQAQTVNNWDENLVTAEQQQLLSGESVPRLESKNADAEREQNIDVRQQQMQDFDALFDEDEDANNDDITAMIQEINDESVKEFYAEPAKPAEDSKSEVKAETTEGDEGDEGAEMLKSQPATAEKNEVVEPVQTAEEKHIEQDNVVVPASIYSTLTLEQLNARLEKLNERLKVNEKELKANRKEYLPLARVKKTLDRDEQKLRRREAIVARKKVILYGVNNYVDIDEEKAKKLSEDLDLLDGLRLSVQHCEDVMATNKDRYPLLETTNKILVQVNRDLKDDIAEVQDAITAYKKAHPDE